VKYTCRYLYIMGFSVPSFAISFSSAALGLAFIFGDSLRKVYESIVWLFGVNPYDAGAALCSMLCSKFVCTACDACERCIRSF
jgi:hypothetical protein